VVLLSDFLIDTVALVRYLEDDLPRRPDEVFREGEQGRNHLLLPQVALGEYVYIALRGRVRSEQARATVEETVQHILASDFIAVTAMPSTGWDWFLRLAIPEMHDRLIAAEAMARGIPLVSNDPAFESVAGLELVWK
jgi:predicted nucleic acid-binding protein